MGRAWGGGGGEAVRGGGGEPSGDNRGAGETIAPGHRLALRVKARRDPVVPIGPVHVVLDVLLARPHDLHRAIDLLGNLNGANCAISFQPPAKAAADEMIMDNDL